MGGCRFNMICLNVQYANNVWKYYCRNHNFFPLIGAVIQGSQYGHIYVDDSSRVDGFYVEHAFGFAQIFGQVSDRFLQDLENYLLRQRAFSAAKVRLYTPMLPTFLANEAGIPFISQRQRFVLDVSAFAHMEASLQPRDDLNVVAVTEENVIAVNNSFHLVDRFWCSPLDFVRNAMAVVLEYRGQLAAICYAAAVSHARAEIDVCTLPQFRNLGLAKRAVALFVNRCQHNCIAPLWDCFTNNEASMCLCKAAGFVPSGNPYPFFTITR